MQLATTHEGTPNGTPTIEPELVLQSQRSGRNVLLVDVRDADAFRDGHVSGARSIPIHQLVTRAFEITSDRSAAIVIVSQRGDRAKVAASSLRLAGFTEVSMLAGGMDRWIASGLPIEHTPPPSISSSSSS